MQLNKWLGGDKPKKDDFNSDNQKLDDAYRMLSQDLEQLENESITHNNVCAQALSEHTGNNNIHVTSALTSSITSHTSNTGIHVTQAEKNAWSTGGAELAVGYYTGNGSSTQSVSLGYQPKFGLIFAVDEGLSRISWTSEQLQNFCGCLSQHGCSLGLSLNSSGFTVTHNVAGGADGFTLKFNTSNTRYVYFVWK